MAGSNTDLSNAASATTGWVVLADGSRINLGAILNAIRVPTQALSLDTLRSDTANLATPIRSLRVGTTAGDVTVRYQDDTVDTTIPNVQVGEHLQGIIIAIRITGTTAVGLTGWL